MATKKKPSGWNSLTNAQQEAWKKKNFDKNKTVTEAQLNKLRKEGTPTKAIAKYKNDPAMREALNRFYGKSRVDSATGSSSSKPSATPPSGGPGSKMPKPPRGGPGAKTGPDGRVKPKPKPKGLSNQDKLMIGAGAGALGLAALKGRQPKRKAIGPGPIGRAQMDKAKGAAAARKTAGITSRGRHAAPGKTVKSPLARTSPGKHSAPNNTFKNAGKNAGKVLSGVGKSKAGKVAYNVLGRKYGVALTALTGAYAAYDSRKKKK